MTDKTSNPVLLKVRGLKVAYGGIQAVKGVDFEVHEGELVSLIGSNGAGKTTTMKAVTATQPISGGKQPATPPHTMFIGVRRLSQIV